MTDVTFNFEVTFTVTASTETEFGKTTLALGSSNRAEMVESPARFTVNVALSLFPSAITMALRMFSPSSSPFTVPAQMESLSFFRESFPTSTEATDSFVSTFTFTSMLVSEFERIFSPSGDTKVVAMVESCARVTTMVAESFFDAVDAMAVNVFSPTFNPRT